MIKTIVFNGGLGNQMFQYAFYLKLKELFPRTVFLFDISKSQICHNGYELDKVFNIDSLKQTRNYRYLERYFAWLFIFFRNVTHPSGFHFHEEILTNTGLFVKYEGYWQTEKYFIDIKDTIYAAFSFRTNNLSNNSIKLSNELRKGNHVSVHVRRGDYLSTGFYGPCTLAYYKKAIDFFQKIDSHFSFVFFSDDIEWVKENIKIDNGIYVTWNKRENSWQDMYLMSICSHNIIANSSFSWWGAWMNKNPHKIVVAPHIWFESCPKYDILPSSWIPM